MHWELLFFRRRVSSKNVINRPPLLTSKRQLTIAIEIGHSPRICKTFNFISAGMLSQNEVGVSMSPELLVLQTDRFNPTLHPILKVIFLVLLACSHDWYRIVKTVR